MLTEDDPLGPAVVGARECPEPLLSSCCMCAPQEEQEGIQFGKRKAAFTSIQLKVVQKGMKSSRGDTPARAGVVCGRGADVPTSMC